MGLSRKHFVAIAAIIREAREKFPESEQALDQLTRQIGDVCMAENQFFDRGRFELAADRELV